MDALQSATYALGEGNFGVAAESKMEEKPELLPLDVPERIAVFKSNGKTYRHIFRRFTATDWEKFYAGVVVEFKKEKGGMAQVIDLESPSLTVYTRAILRVEGYQTRDGRKPEELPAWPECVPQHHRLAAMGLIMNITHSEAGDESMLEAEGISVSIDAMWNEGEPGAMKQYRGLVHHFAMPTAEHRRRVLKAKNRAFVVGGSRNGTTVIPSGHPVLVKLYDELVESVEGYSINGRALSGKDQAVREMDAFHKAAVVARLFQTSSGIDEENTEEEVHG
jgi:hypothetical protein